MNKTRSSKLTYKTQHPMRVLLKMRNNHKQALSTLDNQSQKNNSIDKSNAMNLHDGSEDHLQKSYSGKNRMKTEYSDRFGHFGRGNDSFNRLKYFHDAVTLGTEHADLQSNTIENTGKVNKKEDTTPMRETLFEKKANEERKQQQKAQEAKTQSLSFELIEDKIENLMNKRLNQCLQFKKNSDWVIDTQLSKLVEAYKEVRSAKNPQNQEEDIQLLQRRITMLQKLIAENMIESEIAKKYYQSRVANSHWKQVKTESYSMIKPRRTMKLGEMKYEALFNTSNNQQSYQQPNRSAYNIEKRGNYFFNPDRHMQPLPRSSYNRDFLIYGAVVNETAYKPSENECLKVASSAKIMNSLYKTNFGPKKAEKFNLKDLDACRDKIKNLPVIFGKKQKDMLAYNLASLFNLKKSKEKTPRSIDQNKSLPNPKYFASESRREYIQAVQISPSQIKHKNLQKLKYSYKKQLHV